MGCMTQRVPVFMNIENHGEYFYESLCFTELKRVSDGASVYMDIESLDEDELRR